LEQALFENLGDTAVGSGEHGSLPLSSLGAFVNLRALRDLRGLLLSSRGMNHEGHKEHEGRAGLGTDLPSAGRA
jgi:hypothetical protein